MTNFISNSFKQSHELIETCLNDSDFQKSIQNCLDILTACITNGGKIFTCGNGGSYCDAIHFSEELTGRFQKDRPPIGCFTLGEAGHMSCVSNDYGYEHVFSRQVESLGRSGDVLLAISTSGNSENILLACQAAKKNQMQTIALLGKGGGKLKPLVENSIIVPSQVTHRIQEIHTTLVHVLIEGIERQFYPELY
jgi:D-sedoheptulose 7-phosphate isomerase